MKGVVVGQRRPVLPRWRPPIPPSSTRLQFSISGHSTTNRHRKILKHRKKVAASLGTWGVNDRRVSSLGFLIVSHMSQTGRCRCFYPWAGTGRKVPRRARFPLAQGQGKGGIKRNFCQYSPCSIQWYTFSAGLSKELTFSAPPTTPQNQAACPSPPPGGWSCAWSGSESSNSCRRKQAELQFSYQVVSTGPTRHNEI